MFDVELKIRTVPKVVEESKGEVLPPVIIAEEIKSDMQTKSSGFADQIERIRSKMSISSGNNELAN